MAAAAQHKELVKYGLSLHQAELYLHMEKKHLFPAFMSGLGCDQCPPRYMYHRPVLSHHTHQAKFPASSQVSLGCAQPALS